MKLVKVLMAKGHQPAVAKKMAGEMLKKVDARNAQRELARLQQLPGAQVLGPKGEFIQRKLGSNSWITHSLSDNGVNTHLFKYCGRPGIKNVYHGNAPNCTRHIESSVNGSFTFADVNNKRVLVDWGVSSSPYYTKDGIVNKSIEKYLAKA